MKARAVNLFQVLVKGFAITAGRRKRRICREWAQWTFRWSLFLIEIVDPQTFSLSRKCGACVALECEAKVTITGLPVQAVLRRTQLKAVPEWVTNKVPAPPKGTPLQHTATWPGPQTDPPVEVDEMEVEDANPLRNTRARTLIEKMEGYNVEKVKNFRWEFANWSISCSVLEM